MAVSFEAIKIQILIVLYDYMLTSDAENFWYSIRDIRDALPSEVSGAFVKRAIDALVEDDTLEKGIGDPEGQPANSPVFSLTQEGILEAEKALVTKGWDLADYYPAPSIDRIISRADDPELHSNIHNQIKKIAGEVRESNEAGELLGEVKDIVNDELALAEKLSGKESFRIQRLAAFLLPTLRFVSDKFFGTAISETAKRLIELLMKLI